MPNSRAKPLLQYLLTPATAVFLLVTALYYWLSQGLVLWDDDYGLWQAQLVGTSWIELIAARLLSPFPYTDSSWGFTERAVQLVVYRILFALSKDYSAVPFFIYKSLSIGALAGLLWILMRELGANVFGRIVSLLLIFTAPNTIAAFTWHADFAPTAESLYACSILLMIRLLDTTPATSIKKILGDRKLLVQWLVFCAVAYLGYKTKANLKLIPFVLLGATIYLKPGAFKFIALPVFLLVILAVPWSISTLTSLPPWFPGSGGSTVSWMYQESGGATKAFALIAEVKDPAAVVTSSTFFPLSIFEIFGTLAIFVVLLLGFVFLTGNFSKRSETASRERIGVVVVILWFLAELAGSTALSDINYFFRVRYAFILIVPLGVLFSVLITRIFEAKNFSSVLWVRIALILFVAVVFYQAKMNFIRGITYRSALGGVMASIDQAYRYVNDSLPNSTLLLLPGFRNYAVPIDAAKSLKGRIEITDLALAKSYPAQTTVGLAWGSDQIDGFRILKTFQGCSGPQLLNIPGQCEALLSLYEREPNKSK